MRKLLFLLLVSVFFLKAQSQRQPAVIDSFKISLEKATTNQEKIEVLSLLSRVLMQVNPAESDMYGQQMIELAEMSRDRNLMIKALIRNGQRYADFAGRKNNIDKAINFYNQALEIARKNKMDEQMISIYLLLSEVNRNIPDNEAALSYCNQAYSYIGIIKNDSLTAKVHAEYGSVYLAKNEKLLSLRNYMAGLRMAEELKNNTLLRLVYSRLSLFYKSLGDYDKAIDYQMKAYEKLELIKNGQTPYSKVQDLSVIGKLYAEKKNYDVAMHYFEKSLALADSLKYEPIKSLVYKNVIDNYLEADQPQKALAYFNEHPQLKTFLEAVNFGHFVGQSYAFIYASLGNYDSAKYYYNTVAPFFEKEVSSGNKFGYYYQLGMLYKKTGEIEKSLEYYLKAKQLADEIGELKQMSMTANQLDSVYRIKGDYKQALHYSSQYYLYNDSLLKLGKEKDMMQIEVADEQQRQERIANERIEMVRKRNNIQYLLITIGIAALFIAMVMMGMFKVSATTIKMIGFFAFLMFFEFIFLIFKKNIYSITKGEPWKDLLFMILLAAILLPLHHWLEHKVIHYLTSHNRLTASGRGLINKMRGRKTPTPK